MHTTIGGVSCKCCPYDRRVTRSARPALILLFGAWFLIPRAIQTLKTAKGVHTAVGAEASYTGLASAAQRGLFYLTIGFCLWIIALLWRRSPAAAAEGL